MRYSSSMTVYTRNFDVHYGVSACLTYLTHQKPDLFNITAWYSHSIFHWHRVMHYNSLINCAASRRVGTLPCVGIHSQFNSRAGQQADDDGLKTENETSEPIHR